MIRIGLTGGMGSGKSTVSRMLAELGARVLDGDHVVHLVYAKGSPVWKKLVQEFGKDILAESGDIDRKKLGATVFREAGRLGLLTATVQPEVSRTTLRLLQEMEQTGVQVAVYESATLVETHDIRMMDQVWSTYAPKEVVLERIMNRPQGVRLTREEAKRRIATQMPGEEKLKHAHVVIRTDCSLEETREQVAVAWRQIQSEVARGTFVSHRAPTYAPADPSTYLSGRRFSLDARDAERNASASR
jgi:dephospho-CoA kinase